MGLDVIKYAYLGEIKYNYNQKVISLLIYHVNQFKGQAVCQESQIDLRWVELNAKGRATSWLILAIHG